MSFGTINYFLFEKQRQELDSELLEEFSPYLTNKAFSFVKGGMYVDYINDTLNTYGNTLKLKEDQFRFYDNMIPRMKKTPINYIKRPKATKKEDRIIPEFYSSREFDMFEEQSKYSYD